LSVCIQAKNEPVQDSSLMSAFEAAGIDESPIDEDCSPPVFKQ
jgi:hypothetical protein